MLINLQYNYCSLYDLGFREQASQWPVNPLHGIINWVNSVVDDPRKTIADMGCGDAELSKHVKNTVYSFDLVSTNPSVIAGKNQLNLL